MAEVGAVAGVRDALAGAERGDEVVEDLGDAHHHPGEGREVLAVDGVDEHAPVGVGEREGAGLGRVAAGDGEEPGHGLLLEPLPGVALVDAGTPRELGGGGRALAVEHLVEAELAPEVDGEELERADRGGHHPLGQVRGLGVLGVRHALEA